ncbi:MAG: CHAT domain-containing protein [Cyclobacteriaceae bacterium]|nr:CHAT domain-containing protein [Cyclobacteriaceae bacterium]
MKLIRITVFLCLFSLISGASYAQKKFDKALAKADKSYANGDYSKALKELNKYKSMVTSKLGPSNASMPAYYTRFAKFNLSYGVLASFESSLDQAITISISIFGENTPKHASTLIDVAEVYNLYGYYRKSREHLDKASEILSKEGQEDPVIKTKQILELAEAMIGQGFCNDALDLLRSNERFFANRAVDKETTVVDGKIKTERVPETEWKPRYSSYARMLSLMTLAYGRKGDIDSVDVSHKASRPWISKNQKMIGETSLVLTQADYWFTLMYVENNDGLIPSKLTKSEPYADFSKQLTELKKRTSPSVPLGHDLYLAELGQLQMIDNRSRYSNLRAEYDRMLGKYFTKSSLININLKAVEFDRKLSKDRTSNLERDAERVLNNEALPQFYKTRVNVLEFLYGLYVYEKKYSLAESTLNQITANKMELYGENSPEYHLALLAKANFFLDYTNKIEEAGKIYKSSYEDFISKQISLKHKDHLNILYHLASYYELTDNFALASSTLEKASLAARDKYNNIDPTYAISLNQMAKLRIKIGEYDKAEAAIYQSIKVFELKENKDDKWKSDYINALETQAKLYGIKGMFDEAQENLVTTRNMIRKSKVPISNELSSAEELASLLIQLGSYTQTETLLNDLIPQYEKLYGPESIRLIEPLTNRGRLMLARGDYTEAERVAQRANQIAIKTYSETSTKAAPSQRLLSDINYSLGDYDKAEDNITKALFSLEKQFGRFHVDVARSISQLALIKFHNGDNKREVEKLMVEARDIIADKLGKDNPQYAEILKNIAQLYISEKKYDIAFNSLTIAENIWLQKTGNKRNINTASIYTLTGDVYYQQTNYVKAEEFYNKALTIYTKNSFSTTHPEYVKVISKLSKVYYMKKDYKRAKTNIESALNTYENYIKQFFPALSEREKAKYWNTIKSDFEFYNTLAFGKIDEFKDLGANVYNYQLLTKALLLSSSIKIRERIMNSTDTELKTQYQNWIQKKELLTLALSLTPTQLVESEIDPAALTAEVERLERFLSQRSELFGQNFESKRITFTDVVKSLKPNEVAIEMVRFRVFNHHFTDSIVYAAMYVRNDSKKPEVILLNDGKRMEARNFRYYRNAIQGKIHDTNSYQAYWAPIQQKLGQVSTIYLSADGIYNQINLEAIPSPDGRYILDNANIVMISNTKDLYLNKIKSRAVPDNVASMFGNPTFYLTASNKTGPITPLPGTEIEINQIQQLLKQKGWKTEEYLDIQATEDRIKELNSPKIFHVATHGFYKPSEEIKLEDEMEGNELALTQNPLMRNGLLLKGAGDLLDKTEYNYNMENGILTAYEAMNLNLDKTDLVVLSACETGLGELQQGEGVFGLQRAFLVAGAKILIMSMFKVDDEATQKLMLKFYQKWLTTNNIRQSFIDAKKELRTEYPEPIYWGAFMMIGLE